jgi:hypothetical protein
MDYNDVLWVPFAALIVQTGGLLLLTTAALRDKDRQRE